MDQEGDFFVSPIRALVLLLLFACAAVSNMMMRRQTSPLPALGYRNANETSRTHLPVLISHLVPSSCLSLNFLNRRNEYFITFLLTLTSLASHHKNLAKIEKMNAKYCVCIILIP